MASEEECRKQMKAYFENQGWVGTLTGIDLPEVMFRPLNEDSTEGAPDARPCEITAEQFAANMKAAIDLIGPEGYTADPWYPKPIPWTSRGEPTAGGCLAAEPGDFGKTPADEPPSGYMSKPKML